MTRMSYQAKQKQHIKHCQGGRREFSHWKSSLPSESWPAFPKICVLVSNTNPCGNKLRQGPEVSRCCKIRVKECTLWKPNCLKIQTKPHTKFISHHKEQWKINALLWNWTSVILVGYSVIHLHLPKRWKPVEHQESALKHWVLRKVFTGKWRCHSLESLSARSKAEKENPVISEKPLSQFPFLSTFVNETWENK